MFQSVHRLLHCVAIGTTFLWMAACGASSDSNLSDGGTGATGAAGGNSPGESGASTGGGTQNGGQPPATSASTYGEKSSGDFNLGPVDFAQTAFPNACAPAGGYKSELRGGAGLGGEFIAGVSNAHAGGGSVCDACIFVQTAKGKSIVVRVVTYGDTNQPGDIDVSPSAYEALNSGEYPRSMTWQFAKCPEAGTLRYEFQEQANAWWTSLWVRNPRVPVTKVEVKSANHANFYELRRETDGTVNDDGGFGAGAFTLRITAMDGQVITETLPSFSQGQLIVSNQQFQ